ncbi:MAG TPA: multiheme c-type cytochrome, partial [Polyangiaceae bacterium]|nr:multiheme c-type cytochrome [Polyangiaceae bacterium]
MLVPSLRRPLLSSLQRPASARSRSTRVPALSAALGVAIACSSNGEPEREPTYLSREQLMDPQTCAGCHTRQYEQWASSMHAYASDDPLFLAMNARGQREGAIGDFCVKCHAPMAVRTGATTDGLNLDSLPASLKGVTCYFCHSVDAVEGTHNNPLRLADDGVLRGPFADPTPNSAHPAAYSELHDRDHLSSSDLCGSCHDIVNDRGTHLERTFAEWQGSVFSQPLIGTTCGQCHMDQSTTLEPVATLPNLPARRLHDHRFPGVDLPLTPLTGEDELRAATQAFLDTSLQSALCVRGAEGAAQIQVVLDNVAAGHSWPSGAAQDRRAWIEVTAYDGDAVIYQSGVVPQGTAVTALDDPDLWLIRDCLFDESGAESHMFWEAQEYESNLLPAQVTFDASDPRYYQSHVFRNYPTSGFLPTYPDRVTMRVYIQAVGLDVFDDLVESGDLVDGPLYRVDDLRAGLAPLQVGEELTWTLDEARETYIEQGLPVAC